MRIAVTTGFLLNDYPIGYENFLYECFSHITKAHPGHEFLFIADLRFNKKYDFDKNVTVVAPGPSFFHPLLRKLWYDVKLPAILKKFKADVLVSCNGFCSLTTKVPQCLLVHDLSFLSYPSFFKRTYLLFYKRYMPTFLNRAKIIVSSSAFLKKEILSAYKIDAGKIDVIPIAIKDIYRPLNDREKEEVKNKLTNGKEYFISVGPGYPLHNLTRLLKAFSIFKKKQKSNWMLVIAGRQEGIDKRFTKNLESYKYREDVLLTGYPGEELVKAVGSAYALVYPSFYDGVALPVLEAMHCNIPVITSENSAMQEIAEDAALYVNPNDHNDIADKMMLLYKDENLRSRLIQKGKTIGDQYTMDKSAELLWQSIMKAVG